MIEEARSQLATTCLQNIQAATPTRTKKVSLLLAVDAEMLSGIFDDSIAPPACLLDVVSTESGSESDGDVFDTEDTETVSPSAQSPSAPSASTAAAASTAATSSGGAAAGATSPDTPSDAVPEMSPASSGASPSSADRKPATPVKGGRRPTCPLPGCGKTFANDPALYGHMRVHGGVYSKRSRSSSSGTTSDSKRRTLASDSTSNILDEKSPSQSPAKAAQHSPMEVESTNGAGAASITTGDGSQGVVKESGIVADAPVATTVVSTRRLPGSVVAVASVAFDAVGSSSTKTATATALAAPLRSRESTTARTETAAEGPEDSDDSSERSSTPRTRPSSAPAGLTGASSMAIGDSHRSNMDSLVEHHESRVGSGYQATIPPPLTVDDDIKVERDEGGGPSRVGELLWTPEIETPEVDLTDYLNFACTKGMLGPGMERWTSRGCEHALHLMHKVRAGKRATMVKLYVVLAHSTALLIQAAAYYLWFP